MLTKIRNYWNSLPHPVQAAIMLFAGAATGAAIGHHQSKKAEESPSK